MVDGTDTTAILPNSYHSSHSENITQSDSHGTSEQTIQTETRRVIETTMRMEHKSPLPDLEYKLTSPRPILNNEVTTFENESSYKQSPHQQSQFDHTAQNHKFETKRIYESTNETQYPTHPFENGINRVQSSEFEKKEYKSYNSIMDRIKTIEEAQQHENNSSRKPLLENGEHLEMMKGINGNIPALQVVQPPFENGPRYEAFKPNAIQETIQNITNKFEEYERYNLPQTADLKAPALVKYAIPNVKPYMNGCIHSGYDDDTPIHGNDLALQPGEPPEMCFAPRIATEQKVSMVERIEKNLERDLAKGPSKVLPHSVRTIPPSPQCISSHPSESPKRNFIKQTQQYDFNSSNHSNNTFYEHTKPMSVQNHQSAIRNELSPIKFCEKVRLDTVHCSLFCALH